MEGGFAPVRGRLLGNGDPWNNEGDGQAEGSWDSHKAPSRAMFIILDAIGKRGLISGGVAGAG